MLADARDADLRAAEATTPAACLLRRQAAPGRPHSIFPGVEGTAATAGGAHIHFPVGQPAKAAACFARRVKRGSQKYIAFRMEEVMI
jgi:hypothetical protein